MEGNGKPTYSIMLEQLGRVQRGNRNRSLQADMHNGNGKDCS